ncbi:hypothetical protein B0H16DRAFT_1749692 [Mycena metata]|uniref:Uncharacterized protein n=1 Tax=Mycena metata TaxID=1033252 RepID=A0AAD7GMW8_9AGAR|nr:hypothetical protein B0H16DRAFT_1749692 [Mycena metata]
MSDLHLVSRTWYKLTKNVVHRDLRNLRVTLPNGALSLDATDNHAEIAGGAPQIHLPVGTTLLFSTLRAYRAAGGADGENDNGHGDGHRDGEEEEEKVSGTRAKTAPQLHARGDRLAREPQEQEDPALLSLAHGRAQNTALIAPDGSYKQVMGQSYT